MKKRYFVSLAISVVIMLLLPCLAVTFVKGDGAMAVCFLLFFAINPLYSIVTGIFAGKQLKTLWGMPIILVILFLAGTWIFFDMGEMAFLWYAGIYLIIGMISMMLSAFIRKKIKS